MNISGEKKKFLESIGIDINNIPAELEKHSDAIEDTFSEEEIEFLMRENLTGRYIKSFSLKDLVGTIHPDYADKTWLEAFLSAKRGDGAVREYFKNPDYYSKDLKKLDQSDLSHETPLELYESNGKFFINGGNNRLSLIMMKYLAEMSKAQTEEEKARINEEYTFVAEVQSTPKDKDIMYMVNMLREKYEANGSIRRVAKDEESCEYTIQVEDRIIKINSKEELEQALRETYHLDKAENLEELKSNIINLMKDGRAYQKGKYEKRGKILNEMFPNLYQFQENLMKLRKLGIEDKLYEGIDLKNINFSELSNKAILIVKEEEKAKVIEQQKKAQEKEEKNRAVLEAKKKRDQKMAVTLERGNIENQMQEIPNNLEDTYNQLKQKETVYFNLAKKLGLNYSVTRTDDTDIYASINQIKLNMKKISMQIQKVENLSKLEGIASSLKTLDGLTYDSTITFEHEQMLQKEFEKSFAAKVQNLIKNSKLSLLEQEKGKIESEKITLIGKILGREKLKQAKLNNIELKKKLLMMEDINGKESYGLESSLSDLYAYSQCELGRKLTPEMKQFLSVVKNDSQLKQMIDQQILKKQFEIKVKGRGKSKELLSIRNNRKVNTRYQTSILQTQNNEMSKQIRENQTKMIVTTNVFNKHRENNKALAKFQNIVNEINLYTRTKQQQREKNENEMQMQ